jgi:hypothetical protein
MMRPEMVYAYPLWTTGLLLVVAALAGVTALELLVRRLLPPTLRRSHNDVAAAMFGIIGVTYAVLLAFVAMLAWEGFNRAEAVVQTEATVLDDVHEASRGFADPALRDGARRYAALVITQEWPALAAGRPSDAAQPVLDGLGRAARAIAPADAGATNRQAELLHVLMRLRDTRAERMLAARTTIPPVVWVVTLLGGVITVAFGSFLGAPSLAMHLAMSGLLAVSGSLVLLLIIALSNPFRGDFHVSPQPFTEVLSRIGAPAGE